MTSEWMRLDAKVIWVDLAKMVLSLIPMALTTWLFGDGIDGSVFWPALSVAVIGVVGAVTDLLRWLKTRYRITDERVECRTGLFVRSNKSIRRDRIRSVDTSARLRHRLAGLRVVVVRAGERGAMGDTGVKLDAVSAAAAARLQAELPTGRVAVPDSPAPSGETVLATLRWQWLFYNVFTVWALAMAAGLLWGGYWLGNSVGLDLASFVANLADWGALGLAWTITIGVLAAWAVGAVGLGANFFAENWNFRLTWTTGPNGTVLRTTKGLFRIRQVDRDEARLRGIRLAQPLPWRWIGLTDTTVISTGLSWSASTVVPRGPIGDALRVAAAVLRDDRLLNVPLTAHPRAALRRRIGWAVLVTLGLTAVLTLLPDRWWLVGVAALPVFVWFAALAYRALGHALVGAHLVIRGGLNRTLVVLRRDAVIGWTFRQSVLQRRLGLLTVRATTAAGSGGYTAPDLAAADAVALADRVVPGLLTRYLPDQRRGEMPGLQPTVGSNRPH